MKSQRAFMVCGLGASGLAAARLLRSENQPVVAVDERDTPTLRAAAVGLTRLGCEVFLGCASPPAERMVGAIVSPGLDINGPLLTLLRKKGVPLLSEVELGWSRFQGRSIAVTGSNGKSSVVKALAEAFQAAGHKAVACGNYGLPVCDAVLETPDAEWLVIEVSSFQAETLVEFRPDIGVLLNRLPNHLDRHGSMEAYTRLKARLFARQGMKDVAVVPSEWLDLFMEESGGRGSWKTTGSGALSHADYIYLPSRVNGPDRRSLSIEGSYFDNAVLGPNAAAVLAATDLAGLSPRQVARVLQAFQPLPHRTQRIAVQGGVVFVDDSKATNLASLTASIRMQNGPVHLIAGGRSKEVDFSVALPVLQENVRAVYLIGEAAADMGIAWGASVPCRICGTLERAVAKARRVAEAGEVVLLAPGGTSYDQFGSYAERGEAFQKLVLNKD
ncbi:MAG: UDP-N-acetylmuramoyl-L-alanine--D-glutamate ligase [Verrucomicrobiota bacterium]|jgi:UDP-N-acetylmuramoylalanine--D-glutamate ligase|nr:UDP-N-acetylmuramoyl-L-alanine--D-glutamate ligase [Verrucomicrobiota bacterium]